MMCIPLYLYIYINYSHVPVRAIYTKSHFYRCFFNFIKIMLFHFNENLHELSLHLNIMYMCLLFYIVDDLVCRVRLTHYRSNY